MELCAVALDAEGEPAGLVRVRYGEIDAEARGADLALHVVAQGLEPLADLDFELAVKILAGDFPQAEIAGLGEGQEQLQGGDTSGSRPFEIDVGAREVAEDLAPQLGP